MTTSYPYLIQQWGCGYMSEAASVFLGVLLAIRARHPPSDRTIPGFKRNCSASPRSSGKSSPWTVYLREFGQRPLLVRMRNGEPNSVTEIGRSPLVFRTIAWAAST